jgi:hypothetical protein
MRTRNAKIKDKELARELDEIRQINKKNHQAQLQLEEEEAKRRQDKALTLRSEAAPAMPRAPMDDTINNFASKVRNIMDGVHGMETSNTKNVNKEDLRSPPKKQPTTKTVSRRNFTRQVSPAEEGQKITASAKMATFLENFVYPHFCIILKLAVVLKSDKAFEEFTQALMALLSNAQLVDPKFVINPLNPNSKERNINLKGEISTNMTKLGTHVKILGNDNVFNKQKVWNREVDDTRSKRKANKKEEYKDPTVYFSMIVSSEVTPKEIIDRTTHEWARLNRVRLQVKELQFVDSETVVTFY